MKRISFLLAIILSTSVQAQPVAVQNSAAKVICSGAGVGCSLAVDSTGALLGGASATSVGKSEDAAHTTGDTGVLALGVRNDSAATLSGTNLDYTPFSMTPRGDVRALIEYQSQGTPGQSLLKLEDGTSASGDANIAVMGVRQDTVSGLTSASGDYGMLKIGPLDQLYTQEIGGIANGGTLSGITSAASNNSTALKGSAGQVYDLLACNGSAAVKYVKLYNKATAPTCGTDTPVLRITVPASNCAPPISSNIGLAFSLGIGYCIVTGVADTDNTAVAANDVFLSIGYK